MLRTRGNCNNIKTRQNKLNLNKVKPPSLFRQSTGVWCYTGLIATYYIQRTLLTIFLKILKAECLTHLKAS